MLARELVVSYRASQQPTVGQARSLADPAAVAAYAHELQPTPGVHWQDEAVEIFAILCLDSRHRPIAYHVVSRGTLDASLVHAREVYRAAIVSGASAIVLLHNHPSGDPTPSGPDIVLTRRLREVGDLVGIAVLDHVILGNRGTYASLHDRGSL